MKYLYLLVPLSLFLLTGTPSVTFANLLGRLFLIETVKANENQNQNVKSYKIVKEISVQILGAAGSGSGVLVRKEEEKYTVLTAWHVIKDNLPGEEIEGRLQRMLDPLAYMSESDIFGISVLNCDFFLISLTDL